MQDAYPGKDLEAMGFARNYHRWILDLLRPHVGGRVGEVGAGIGDFTRLLLETRPSHIDAWEPSPNLYAGLVERLGTEPTVSLIPERFFPPPEPLDFLCYINVLEHIEDDQDELTRARDALRPNGRLCLFVPALKCLYSEQDAHVGHFRRYQRRELRDKLARAGFKLVEDRWFDFAGVLPWWLFYRVMRRRVTPGAVGSYDRWVVPVMRRAESLVHPPVGKNLLMVARPAA